MYLFILESIGTQELILIGLVALIVFGPRKLPELAKMLGKTMTDFKKVTNEFKGTWEKEVAEDAKLLKKFGEDPLLELQNQESVEKIDQKELSIPSVRELDPEEVKQLMKKNEQEPKIVENRPAEKLTKTDWL